VSLGAALDQVVSAEDPSPGSFDLDGVCYSNDNDNDGGGYRSAPYARQPLPVAASSTSFELHGTLVELSGPFKLLMPGGNGTREHGGRLILTVPKLDEGNRILLLPGGCMSHPLCAMPGAASVQTLQRQMRREGARMVVVRARA